MFKEKEKHCFICGKPIGKIFIDGLFSIEDDSDTKDLCEDCKRNHTTKTTGQDLIRPGYIYAIEAEQLPLITKKTLYQAHPYGKQRNIFVGICEERPITGERYLKFPMLTNLDMLYNYILSLAANDFSRKLKSFNPEDMLGTSINIYVSDIQEISGMVLLHKDAPNLPRPIDITSCILLTLNDILSNVPEYRDLLRINSGNNLLYIVEEGDINNIVGLLSNYKSIEEINIDIINEYENEVFYEQFPYEDIFQKFSYTSELNSNDTIISLDSSSGTNIEYEPPCTTSISHNSTSWSTSDFGWKTYDNF